MPSEPDYVYSLKKGRTNLKYSFSLIDYIASGYSAIFYNSADEQAALSETYMVSRRTGKKLIVWSLTTGILEYSEAIFDETAQDNELAITDYVKKTIVKADELTPDEQVLLSGMKFDENGKFIFVLLDFHPNWNNQLVWRTAKDCFAEAYSRGIAFVFVSSNTNIPKELEHYVEKIEKQLPNKDKLRELAVRLTGQFDIQVDTAGIDKAAEAASGLTVPEATDAYSMSLYRTHSLDPSIISFIKKEKLLRNSTLEYIQPNNYIIGGLNAFKAFANERLAGFEEKARIEKLPYPKGVLLVGVPGCGKSLAAKALSQMWQKPLLKLDVGRLFGSLVGLTEERTREALKITESMSPCILWIDEIEKGLSGVSSSGILDSGVTARMFGTILTWMQEKEKPIFVIATANDVSKLPPELLRKGRFDEIFFVDLPNSEERKEIWKIQLEKYKGTLPFTVSNRDLNHLSELTDGFTGAEIEELIISVKYKVYNENRQFTKEDFVNNIFSVHPCSKGIMAKNIQDLRRWCIEKNVKKA